MIDDHVDVWCVSFPPEPDLTCVASALLSADEHIRASSYRTRAGRDTFVQSRAVLRCLIARRCDRPPHELIFGSGPWGKPSLTAPSTALRFNLSHSGHLAAYAFANDSDVGIDVEYQRHVPGGIDIAKRYFSPQEFWSLRRLTPLERDVAFLDYWVRKEAFIKALGGGLSIPLDGFDVSTDVDSCVLRGDGGPTRGTAEWSIRSFSAGPGHRGAVAFPAIPQRSLRVHHARVDDVLSEWFPP